MKELGICKFYAPETGGCMYPYADDPYWQGFVRTSPEDPKTPPSSPSLMEVSKKPAFSKPRSNGRWEYFLLCKARPLAGDGELSKRMELMQYGCTQFTPGPQKLGDIPMYYSVIE